MKFLVIIAMLAFIAFCCWMIYEVNKARKRKEWEIVPRSVGNGKTAIFLERGVDSMYSPPVQRDKDGLGRVEDNYPWAETRVQVGDSFASYDESALAEHTLDAQRMRKAYAKNK